jgi:drug/metabolite transporter (DMT)-like permease
VYALLASLLFGVSTPFAKLLLGEIPSVMLAGLLYLGSGLGLGAWLLCRKVMTHSECPKEASLKASDLPWLSLAIVSGGLVGPVLFMIGLAQMAASTASLLLNLEGVFTACLAWFVFHENFNRRIAVGMIAITLGGVLLSWSGRLDLGVAWGAFAVAGACLCWALDNNFTRKVSAGDPIQIAAIKGGVAGLVNCVLGWSIGTGMPAIRPMIFAGIVGLFGCGLSLVLFILALRYIGTARTGAYFSTAPFLGVLVSVPLLAEPITVWIVVSALLMGIGVWLHLSERHEHLHHHEAMVHDHLHVHDEHHHHHPERVPLVETHSHPHQHEDLCHFHPHYPDIHHCHGHEIKSVDQWR